MIQRLRDGHVDDWCLWAACLLAVAGAVLALLGPAAGANRIGAVAFPFVIGAAAFAANALTRGRNPWLSAVLYTVGAVAILYGLILGLSVPLRLSVEGVCEPAPATCPLGFDRPLTTGESFRVTAIGVLGALSLLFTFVAAEVEYIHRPKASSSSVAGTPPSQSNPPAAGS